MPPSAAQLPPSPQLFVVISHPPYGDRVPRSTPPRPGTSVPTAGRRIQPTYDCQSMHIGTAHHLQLHSLHINTDTSPALYSTSYQAVPPHLLSHRPRPSSPPSLLPPSLTLPYPVPHPPQYTSSFRIIDATNGRLVCQWRYSNVPVRIYRKPFLTKCFGYSFELRPFFRSW